MQLLVDVSQRSAKQRAHTATHLLHHILDKVLSGTKQAGSLVDIDYLRFDFVTKEPLWVSQIQTIEKLVNDWIANDIPVIITEMSLENAKKTGAKAFFEDKYGDIVRVVQIAHPDGVVYLGDSTEFCGWTHVISTWMIGACKITNQEAVASGVRRIEAVTGPRVAFYAWEKEKEQYAYAQLLDCTPPQLTEKIKKVVSSLKELQEQHKQLQMHIVKKALLACPSLPVDQFAYYLNIDTLWIEQISLKQIALCAKVCWPKKNRLLFTDDGQFILCADESNNAKELQQQFWLQWWWDTILIQGKDEKVKNIGNQSIL